MHRVESNHEESLRVQIEMNDVQKELVTLGVEYKPQLDEIAEVIEQHQKVLQELEDDGRDLSIALVGVVKSGKSSLLNALLFDGEEVLPRAATPMTAALTYIRYAPKCRAEVEFFTEKEWEKMLEYAREYERIYAVAEAELRKADAEAERRGGGRRELTRGRVVKHSQGRLTKEYVAAKEIVDSVMKSGLDVSRYLKRKDSDCVIVPAKSPTELVGKMQDYVGKDGKFMPIVCATSIYLNDERLKGYEIVDTPGINDPVIFRGKRTMKSLGSVDVVVSVSMASQFFEDTDRELLCEVLPQEGIKNFLLVASQYDRAVGEVEDEVDHNLAPLERLVESALKVEDDLACLYASEMNKIIGRSDDAGSNGTCWDKLKDARPICVSALAYSISRHWDRLSADERAQLELLNKLIPGYSFPDAEMLRQFSKMSHVQEQIERIKSEKCRIVAERKADAVSGFRMKLGNALKALRDQVSAKVSKIESSDVKSLRKKLKQQSSALRAGEATIRGVFENFRGEVQNAFVDALHTIRGAKSSYGKTSVRTTSETKRYRHDNGSGFLWWRDLTGTRYEWRTRTVRTRYANTYDAVNSVEAFLDVVRRELEETIRHTVNKKVLRERLADTLLELLEGFTDTEPDLVLLKAQLKMAVGKVDVPDVELEDEKYVRMITDVFQGGEVKNSSVDRLQELQHEALTRVMSDFVKQVSQNQRVIEEGLVRASDEFLEQLIKELSAGTEQDINDLKDKEETLKRLRSYLPLIDKAFEACNLP